MRNRRRSRRLSQISRDIHAAEVRREKRRLAVFVEARGEDVLSKNLEKKKTSMDSKIEILRQRN